MMVPRLSQARRRNSAVGEDSCRRKRRAISTSASPMVKVCSIGSIGMLRGQTIEHRSVARYPSPQLLVQPVIDEPIGERHRIGIILVVVQMHDPVIAGAGAAFPGRDR